MVVLWNLSGMAEVMGKLAMMMIMMMKRRRRRRGVYCFVL
jgi:hypothetical protein